MTNVEQTIINEAFIQLPLIAPAKSFPSAEELARRLLPSIHDALLACHPWKFATYTGFPQLSPGLDFIDLPFAYRLPADAIRICKVRPICSPRALRYRVKGKFIHTTSDVAVIEYIYRVPLEDCPAYYLSALVVHLAAELIIPMTASTSGWERLRKLADDARRTAIVEDGLSGEQINA